MFLHLPTMIKVGFTTREFVATLLVVTLLFCSVLYIGAQFKQLNKQVELPEIESVNL